LPGEGKAMKNPKSQARNPKQIQMFKIQNLKNFVLINFDNCDLSGVWNLELGV
jgi:hypothetical protein